MTISDRIFERLQQLAMPQKEFAERAGIQQSTISVWKKNGTNPSSDKILAICRALDVSGQITERQDHRICFCFCRDEKQ